MEETIREVSTMKMGVAVLTETKKKGAGSETLGNYIHRFSGVKKYERAKRGVSVLINKKCYHPKLGTSRSPHNLNPELLSQGSVRIFFVLLWSEGRSGKAWDPPNKMMAFTPLSTPSTPLRTSTK